MKKKEAIARVAYDGISPSQQVEGRREVGDFTITQGSTDNYRMMNAALVQRVLEKAIHEIHDDEDLGKDDLIRLKQALESFRDQSAASSIMKETRDSIKEKFNGQISVLDEMIENTGR